MTEEEAKTKRCCGPTGCGQHRKGANGKEIRGCTASACMAWRWSEMPRPFELAGNIAAIDEPPRPDRVAIDWVWTPFDGEEPAGWSAPGGGYCGLAGPTT